MVKLSLVIPIILQNKEGKVLHTLKNDEVGIHALKVLPDNKQVVSGDALGGVKLWTIADGKAAKKFQLHESTVKALETKDGKVLYSGGLDKKLQLKNLSDDAAPLAFEGHAGGIRCLALSTDGQLLASGGLAKTIFVWDTKTRQQKAALKGHLFSIRALALLPGNKYAVSGADDLTIRVWNIAAGDAEQIFKGHTSFITALIPLSESRFVSAGMDGTIRLWDINDGKSIGMFKSSTKAAIISLAYDAENNVLVAGTRTGKILLISLPEEG